jgi:hypothetical protein
MSPNVELTKREFKRYLQAAGEIADEPTNKNRRGDHLSEQTLIAFVNHTLPVLNREAVKTHLADCEVCAMKLEDARDFFDPLRAGETELSEFEQRRQWRDLREKLPFSELRTVRTERSQVRIHRPFYRNSRAMLALAACLLLTTSVTGSIAFRLWQEKQELQAILNQANSGMVAKIGPANPANPNAPEPPAQIDTPLREITVYDTVRSAEGGKDLLTTKLPAKAEFFSFTLSIVSDSFPTYAIEFTDLNGKPVISQSNLKPNERASEKTAEPKPNQNASLSVSVPRESLQPGQYLFRIYGQRNGQTVLLEELHWSFN